MNTHFKTLSFLVVMALFLTACASQSVQVEPANVDTARQRGQPANREGASSSVQAEPEKVDTATAASYQAVLGKSLNDQEVANFIASNNCSSVAQVQLCQSAGMVLWMDSDQKVKSVFLYPGNDNSFAAYKGELPFGLIFTDTMATVEQKFGHPVEKHAPQAGWAPGLPDEGVTPDHIHYWATYKRFGVTIIYNSPSASDKNATIHAVLINDGASSQ